MKRHTKPFVENISEATAACLVTMVQGNLLAITLGHWLVAAETGLIAGTITSAALMIWSTSKAWIVSLLLGLVTAIIDYMVHPGGFGPAFLEAAVTGGGATALSFSMEITLRSVFGQRDSIKGHRRNIG
jgi:hypothetical protein